MAASSDDSEDDNFVVLGTAVPELAEGEPQKKPTSVQDLTARDKQGRRRFHGAFTGGFSAGYFNTVGTKEGFTPSTFLSSRSQKNEKSGYRPEDFMDEEDFEEHGIAPRKFATVANYTSEERKRKLNDDSKHLAEPGRVDLLPALADLIVPEQLPIGIKLLRKMGWREGQGLGPRVKKKKKAKRKPAIKPDSPLKVYGCARPPSDQDDSDSDSFVPESLSNVTFAPRDVCPISLEAKDDVHGLGYRGLDPSLALPSSHINLFDPVPLRTRKGGKGIQGQAFGVGAFEDEDEDIYTVDNMSNYDITMKHDDDDEADGKFGWTAPRKHGKQVVPVSYVGKLLEGFTLSSQPLTAKKKYLPPVLPPKFKPQHWFRKRREVSHLPEILTTDDHGAGQRGNITAVDRGLMLGETPIVDSVFDLIPKEEKARIEATKEAIAITQNLATKAGMNLTSRFQPAENNPPETNTRSSSLSTDLSNSVSISDTFLAKFKPAGVTHVEPSEGGGEKSKVASGTTPLFQGSLSFQPFRKDAAKQARYDTYLAALKQGINDPYSSIGSSHLTEWEKARERDEFSKAAKIYRPMSALMSSRFVRGAMIDEDRTEVPLDTENEKSDRVKAAEMKMFGKLTREEFEWHPDKMLCRRFNVPNPYPGSDLVGLPTVKRDKYSVFNFLSFGDYQSGEFQEPLTAKPPPEPDSRERSLKSVQSRKATMTSIFKVLDDPDFHRPAVKSSAGSKEKVIDNGESVQKDNSKEDNENEPQADKDLFRAIFKNSDSESSSDESTDEKKEEVAKEKEEDSFAQMDVQLISGITSASSAVPDSEAVSKRSMSQSGDSSVFSVLDDLKCEPDKEYRQKTDDHTQSEALSSRLLPPSDEDDSGGEYGPSLPPAAGSTTGYVSLKHTSEAEKTDKTGNPRDKRHRHKKEKKKKSKHKKEKKHKKHKKSAKSKKSRQEESCSGSEADTEDSDVSDSELLRRLKEVSGSSKTLQLWK